MSNQEWYVETTDIFLSGWGPAAGKINRLIFVCDSLAEAKTVAQNARDREDQEHITVCVSKPSYPVQTHYVQIKTKADYPTWYRTDRPFAKQGGETMTLSEAVNARRLLEAQRDEQKQAIDRLEHEIAALQKQQIALYDRLDEIQEQIGQCFDVIEAVEDTKNV